MTVGGRRERPAPGGAGKSQPSRRPGVSPAGGDAQEAGSATVLMLGVVCVLTTLTLSGVALSGAVLASHRARAAADLAALSGAEVLLRGGGPRDACTEATVTATSNGARVSRCTVAGPSLLVGVSVPVAVRGMGPALATARAGPSPTGSSP